MFLLFKNINNIYNIIKYIIINIYRERACHLYAYTIKDTVYFNVSLSMWISKIFHY